MHRLLVALLAALDAALAAAVGLAAFLAPLTLVWFVVFGVDADWGALWPSAATLWQLGHGVALTVAIPEEVIAALALSPDAAQFTIGLVPLAVLLFTVLFAARSGARGVRAGAWITTVVTGTAVFALITAVVALTGTVALLHADGVGAYLFPPLVYFVGCLVGIICTAWVRGDGGVIDRLRLLIDDAGEWAAATEGVFRGGLIAVSGVIAAGAVLVATAVFVQASDVVGLFESLRVDTVGATVVALGQLLYVPTLVVWAIAWLAGPGFAVGAGTTVSPAGTELGVLPAIPVFGILPEDTSPWTLIIVLVPVLAGAFAGWVVRSRLVAEFGEVRMPVRAVTAVGIAACAAGFGACAAALASGSIGPGRLADVGPHPGLLALALGAEVLVGAAILLLSPQRRDDRFGREGGIAPASGTHDTESYEPEPHDLEFSAPVPEHTALHVRASDDEATEPIDAGFLGHEGQHGGSPDR